MRGKQRKKVNNLRVQNRNIGRRKRVKQRRFALYSILSLEPNVRTTPADDFCALPLMANWRTMKTKQNIILFQPFYSAPKCSITQLWHIGLAFGCRVLFKKHSSGPRAFPYRPFCTKCIPQSGLFHGRDTFLSAPRFKIDIRRPICLGMQWLV